MKELKPNIISLLRRGDEINRVAKTTLDIYETDDFLPIDKFVYNLIYKKYEDYIIGKYQSKIKWCD